MPISGAVVATLPIGDGTDFAEFDPTRGLAFSSNRDGTLSIIAEKIALAQFPRGASRRRDGEIGARTMAIDPGTGRNYRVTAELTPNQSAASADPGHRYTCRSLAR